MTFDWMAAELPLEEQLTVENQIRAISEQCDTETIKDLCKSLLQQNHHYALLLRNATKHIIELELAADDAKLLEPAAPVRRAWWRVILRRN
jgi:hypothetical protein